MVLATKIPRHTSENLASDRLTFSLLYTYKKSAVAITWLRILEFHFMPLEVNS